MQAYGVGGKVLKWVEAFLSQRAQRVCVDGSVSSWEVVTSGVPQGSVLGPLLFLLFINDLADNVKSHVKIFADDTKIYSSANDPTCINTLQADIDRVLRWSLDWQLPFNVTKCVGYSSGRRLRSRRPRLRRNARLHHCLQ